jgi:hypothetical protein
MSIVTKIGNPHDMFHCTETRKVQIRMELGVKVKCKCKVDLVLN